jgi:glutathione synthase/RimK-type ligase-like ATP-grasp enzyme
VIKKRGPKKPHASRTFTEAMVISNKILELLGMSFGAVDFLVTADYKVYFIEINSAPGFSELSKPIYVDAFTRLKTIGKKDLNALINNSV